MRRQEVTISLYQRGTTKLLEKYSNIQLMYKIIITNMIRYKKL